MAARLQGEPSRRYTPRASSRWRRAPRDAAAGQSQGAIALALSASDGYLSHPRRIFPRMSAASSNHRYLVFDVETTGLSSRSRIVEFAGVALDRYGTAIARYETVLDTGTAPGPTWLHGLEPSDVRGAPAFADVGRDIQRLFRDRIPVAHHLRFDWGVLGRAFEPLGVLPGHHAGRRLHSRDLRATLRRPDVPGAAVPASWHRSPFAASSRGRCGGRRRCAPDPPGRRLPGPGRPLDPYPGAWRPPRSVPPAPRSSSAVRVGQVTS